MSRPRLTFDVSMDFSINTDGTVEEFHENAEKIMDELLVLEETDDDVFDATVGSDAAEKVLTIDLLVYAEDQIDCLKKALTFVRTAAHAAGAHTPNWVRFEEDPTDTRLSRNMMVAA